jgi:hypothetical protein
MLGIAQQLPLGAKYPLESLGHLVKCTCQFPDLVAPASRTAWPPQPSAVPLSSPSRLRTH